MNIRTKNGGGARFVLLLLVIPDDAGNKVPCRIRPYLRLDGVWLFSVDAPAGYSSNCFEGSCMSALALIAATQEEWRRPWPPVAGEESV